jgi:hypothetical protein
MLSDEFFSAVFFSSEFLVIKIMDPEPGTEPDQNPVPEPDPDSLEMLDPDPYS